MVSMTFAPAIRPYANIFGRTIAAVLGWRMLPPAVIDSITASMGGLDRIALESTVLQQRGQGDQVKFSFRGSVLPMLSGGYDHHALFAGLAQQLIGHCWEVMKVDGVAPKYSDPVLEFYRHVRNGCFHANRFHFDFKHGQPSNAASWEGLVIASKSKDQTIAKTLQGKRIFRASLDEPDYFLNWGDVLLLLGDASQRAYRGSP